MIGVKYLKQNQSKSNNINHTIHLNYFQKKCYECWAPTKAQFILHELIPQSPLFWNYENHIYAYLISRETKYYLKIKQN